MTEEVQPAELPWPGEPTRPSGSPYITFGLLSVSLLVYVMQFGMVSVALEDLIDDLDAPFRWSGWVLTAFMIGQVVALSVSGRLADRFSPRNVFGVGFGVFAMASLLCATAPSIYVLIGARFVQGLGGGRWSRLAWRWSRRPSPRIARGRLASTRRSCPSAR